MRVLALCAVVIAGSTFATAVENIYGWSTVQPVAQDTWDTSYKWGAEMIGRVYQSGKPPHIPELTRNDKTAQIN
jgi:hypothetical protein